MLLYLFYDLLQRYFHALNVFRYITVRTALASLTALLITLVLGPWVIQNLRQLQIGQFIREEGPKSHQAKAGTPTMGGVLIVGSTVIPTLLWGDLENSYVWLAIFTMLVFGTIGFIDDYNKVVKKRNLGLTGKLKFAFQIIASCAVAVTLLSLTASGTYSTQLSVPFFKNFHPDLVIHSLLYSPYGWWVSYVPFMFFVAMVIVGSSNAVNLTDGLDGLAVGCVVVAAGALTVVDLRDEPRAIFGLSGLAASPGSWRAHCFLRRARWGVARFSLVQRASGGSFHGRRRLARAGRFHRDDWRGHQAGNSSVFCGRRFRSGSRFRHPAGFIFPADRETHFPDVSPAPSF